MYLATVILGKSEYWFWNCTPRKLTALWGVHKKYHGIESNGEQEETQVRYIDQIPGF